MGVTWITNTLSKRLKLARDYLGLSQEEMAKTIGSKTRGYQENERGKTKPNASTIEGFVRKGINANWLVAGIGEMVLPSVQSDNVNNNECYMLPILRNDLSLMSMTPFQQSNLTFHLYNQDKLAFIFSNGDSIEPTIKSTNRLLIYTENTTPIDGNLYVIRFGRNLYAKRVQLLLNGDLTLISNNKDYLPQNISENDIKLLVIIGQIIWLGKEI